MYSVLFTGPKVEFPVVSTIQDICRKFLVYVSDTVPWYGLHPSGHKALHLSWDTVHLRCPEAFLGMAYMHQTIRPYTFPVIQYTSHVLELSLIWPTPMQVIRSYAFPVIQYTSNVLELSLIWPTPMQVIRSYAFPVIQYTSNVLEISLIWPTHPCRSLNPMSFL